MRLFALLLLGASLVAQAQQTTEIYETYLPASKLVPLLEPLIGPDDKITSYRNKLFVKAPQAQQDEILSILQEVDRPLRNVQISLRYADNASLDSSDQQTQITVYRGSSRQQGVEVEMVGKNRFSTEAASADHQIRVLEGEQGVLQIGKEVPVDQLVMAGLWQTGVSTEYRSVGSRLYVVPQLVRDHVRVELFTSDSKQKGGAGKTVEKVEAQSVLLLEPGVWTPMAGSTRSQTQQNNRQTLSTRSSQQSEKSLQIRADIIE